MRSILRFFGVLLVIGTVLPAAGQGARPQFRPAVFVTGPNSLVNRIDVKELLSKGQKRGAVQFGVGVGTNGNTAEAWTYRAMPGSEALAEEVLKQLNGSKFTPAIYDHQPVTVLLYGTVIFDPDEKPHLRIFLNQDPQHIKEANDFIGPQPVFGADSKFAGLHLPEEIPVAIEGVVEVQLRVDAKGNLQELNVTGEDPPLLGFRDSVMADFTGAKFVPAFRDGDAVEATCIMSVCYKPVGVNVGQDQ
jgi:hypothetical protein